jgi:hypothetical protein
MAVCQYDLAVIRVVFEQEFFTSIRFQGLLSYQGRPRTDQICIICRWVNTDGLCRPSIDVMRQILERVGRSRELCLLTSNHRILQVVIDNIVMCRPGSSLNFGMRLKKEIVVSSFYYAAINYYAINRVFNIVSIFLFCRIEVCIMAFSNNNKY